MGHDKSPVVGASVLLHRADGKVVLVKRSREPGKGRWALPGGITKWGERVEETAVREVREETGLDVRLLELVGVYDIIEKDRENRARFHYVTVCFKGERIGGRLRVGSDVENAKWFGPKELNEEMLTDCTLRALRNARVF